MCVCLGLLPADGRNQRGIVKQLFSKKKRLWSQNNPGPSPTCCVILHE